MAAINQITTKVYSDFAGGVNLYLGPRQVQDNESPNATNCDFKGKGGIGNRSGYTQIGSNSGYTSGIYGMTEFHTHTLDYAIKFASNGSNVVLSYSTGGSWTAVTGTTFTDATNMDTVQAIDSTAASYTGADGKLFSFNGTDTMVKFDGTSWASHTGAATLLYGAYYDNRLWGVDPTYKDTLKFSTKTPDATKPLDFVSNGTSSNPGTVTFTPGAGTEITGIKVFKNSLYILTRKEIYSLIPASSANTFTITLVTAAIGCVSHRSISVVENDLFFASDDGIYALGEVSTFVSVRNTNKSLRIQRLFDGLSGASKTKLTGRYFNYKYHLFYPLYGGKNDSCMVYDIRYQAWQDWRNIAANDATRYTDSTKQANFYFGNPTNGKIYQLYSGTTDDGTSISSTWYSKSYDDNLSDYLKLYFYTDFLFGLLTGTVTVTVIFNDSQTSASTSITQQAPMGGFGQVVFGRAKFGGANDATTISSVVGLPLRLKAKGQKFAVQYLVTSTGSWRLDAIGQAKMVMTPWKFPAAQKLN